MTSSPGRRDDWLIILVDASSVVADQPFRRQHDLGCGAIIAIEHMHRCRGIFLRELENVTNVGGSEGIERLIVVADRPEPDAVIDEMIDELDLARIDVLIFINQHVIIGARDRAPIGSRWRSLP